MHQLQNQNRNNQRILVILDAKSVFWQELFRLSLLAGEKMSTEPGNDVTKVPRCTTFFAKFMYIYSQNTDSYTSHITAEASSLMEHRIPAPASRRCFGFSDRHHGRTERRRRLR